MYIPKPSVINVRSLDDTVHLYFVSDFHLKESGCKEELLRKHIDEIQNDPIGLVVLGGDYASYICTKDRRLDYDTISSEVPVNCLADWGNYLVESAIDIVRPIRDKVIVALLGNHETEYIKANQHNIHKTFCDSLSLFNGGYTSVFCLSFQSVTNEKKNMIVYATHGGGGATKRVGKINKLQHYADISANADIVLVGHMHDQVSVVQKRMFYSDGVKYHYKTCVCPGSYLDSYEIGTTLYGEKAGYEPPILGCVRLDITPRNKDVQVKWLR